MRKSLWRILTLDLTDSGLGWLIVSILLPCTSLWIGLNGIFEREIDVKKAEVYGITAALYGCAFVSFGLGSLLIPRPSNSFSPFQFARLLLSLIIAAGFTVAGAISML